jgi:hypothetical protein
MVLQTRCGQDAHVTAGERAVLQWEVKLEGF